MLPLAQLRDVLRTPFAFVVNSDHLRPQPAQVALLHEVGRIHGNVPGSAAPIVQEHTPFSPAFARNLLELFIGHEPEIRINEGHFTLPV